MFLPWNFRSFGALSLIPPLTLPFPLFIQAKHRQRLLKLHIQIFLVLGLFCVAFCWSDERGEMLGLDYSRWLKVKMSLCPRTESISSLNGEVFLSTPVWLQLWSFARIHDQPWQENTRYSKRRVKCGTMIYSRFTELIDNLVKRKA